MSVEASLTLKMQRKGRTVARQLREASVLEQKRARLSELDRMPRVVWCRAFAGPLESARSLSLSQRARNELTISGSVDLSDSWAEDLLS